MSPINAKQLLEAQIQQLLDEHFANYENPHMTVMKIQALLASTQWPAGPAAGGGSNRRH
jgi:hypothetical protein